MTSTLTKENKMGSMPMGKLLINMALPMIISMLIQALYNIVDSVYVARLSEDALTAVSMAFPVQNLMIAFSTGIGVGMNSLLSRSLGSGEQESANRSAGHGIVLSSLCYLLFMILGLFGSSFYFRAQIDIPAIYEGGAAYMTICTVFSFGLFGAILFERILQATGRTVFTMITQGIGAILNIVLDPLLIFGFGPIPAMGIRGAAVATVIGQIVSFLMAMTFHFWKNHEVQLSLKVLAFRSSILKPILAVGVPSIIMMAIGSVMTFLVNGILSDFHSTAVAVFGAYFKLQSFVFMPVFGLNNALISIVAFNYGAKRPDRIKRAIGLGCMVAMTFMTVGFLAFQLFPNFLLSMFEPSELFLSVGTVSLRIISISFLIAGCCVILSGVFQALGNGLYATITSLVRQLVVLVPVAYLLSLSGVLDLVWWSFPIAELVSGILSVFFFLQIYKKKIKPLCEN